MNLSTVLRLFCCISVVFTVYGAPSGKSDAVVLRTETFLNKLNEFVSYVNDGFRSIDTSLRAIQTDMATDHKAIENMNFNVLNQSVSSLHSIEPECLVDWTKKAHRCFRFFNCTTSLSVNDAKSQCESLGGYLASSRSAEDNEWFKASMTKGRHLFLGGNDRKTEGKWVWGDGDSMSNDEYSNWASGQPTSARSNNCMYIHGNSKQWYQLSCTANYKTTRGYICERKLSYHK